MVGLLSIAPVEESVSVSGQTVQVRGVSARQIAQLFVRFPEMYAKMQEFRNADGEVDLSPEIIVRVIPEAIASIIALGDASRYTGDELRQAEDVADNLPIAEQVSLLGAILKLSLPHGIGPFVDEIEAIAGTMEGQDVISAQMMDAEAPNTHSSEQLNS